MSENKGSIICLEGVTISYQENVALRDVSLDIAGGEFVGIIGPNGAGKTTLLTLINGITRIRTGCARVLGHRLNGKDTCLRKRIGYVPQQRGIDPRTPIAVRDAVMIGRYGRLGFFRRPGTSDWYIVDRAIAMVGASHIARRPIGHLSGGEQQRVAIARALAQEPEILLLDEPTASLDRQAQQGLMQLVKAIHDTQGLTTLVVTHHLTILSETCDRVILLNEGRIWQQGSPHLMLREEALSNSPANPFVFGGHGNP